MKRTLASLAAGVVVGSTGVALAAVKDTSAVQDTWIRNGVLCTTTGTGRSRGVVCNLQGSRKLAIVNQRSIIVGTKSNQVLYLTSSR
jgi:hypothetical protein